MENKENTNSNNLIETITQLREQTLVQADIIAALTRKLKELTEDKFFLNINLIEVKAELEVARFVKKTKDGQN